MTPLLRSALLFTTLLIAATAAANDLVPIETVRPPVLPEVRYATRHNFTGEVLYPLPRLFLHRDTAGALTRVQRDLQRRGLGLKVWDAYRPLSVQQKMWDLVRDERYVSNPAKNKGRHTRGTAVDVTLVDNLGRELPMPSDFDDFSERAHRDYQGGTAAQRRNRQLLEDVMKRHGFTGYPTEWWHFDLRNWEKYPPRDIPIAQLADNAGLRGHRGEIEHLVFVWLKRPGNGADKRALIRATRQLRDSTGLIRSARYGGPLPSGRDVVDDSFDVALLMRFADRRDLARFERNEAHKQAVRDVLHPLAARVLIYDVRLE